MKPTAPIGARKQRRFAFVGSFIAEVPLHGPVRRLMRNRYAAYLFQT